MLTSAFVMAALALFGGCVANKSPLRGEEVAVVLLRDLYSRGRSLHDEYRTFQDTGIRVDGAQTDKMHRIVARAQSKEAEPSFCGVVGYQLFLRNGEPDVLVELLAHDVAIISKVTRMKVLFGEYYIVNQDRGDLPWKTFKSKWYILRTSYGYLAFPREDDIDDCPKFRSERFISLVEDMMREWRGNDVIAPRRGDAAEIWKDE